MRIITISREFGSGGRELGKRLADALGFDYYDREIISAISQKQGCDESYVENALDNHGWRNVPLTYRHSFTSYIPNLSKINILLEQKNVIEGIAKLGRDCVIVGQNADCFLAEQKPFTVFVCANMYSKVKRCIERAPENESLTHKQIEQNIRRIDKNRAMSRELVSDGGWGERGTYHLIVDTSDWEMKKLVEAVKDFALRFWEED